jgi:hypothetical protein
MHWGQDQVIKSYSQLFTIHATQFFGYQVPPDFPAKTRDREPLNQSFLEFLENLQTFSELRPAVPGE